MLVAPFVPSPDQRAFYHHFYNLADLDKSGKIDGRQTVIFLRRSGLSNEVLKQIWTTVVATPQTRFLGPTEFANACRLVAHAQNGKPITSDALSSLAQTPLPLPMFQGIPHPAAATTAATPGLANSPPPLSMPMMGGGGGNLNPVSIGSSMVGAVNNNSKTMGPNSPKNVWKISHIDRKGYDEVFAKFGVEKVGGDQAVNFFVKSGMDKASLVNVWNMSDLDKDNKLDRDEFAIAMHLVVSVTRRGQTLPAHLPREIYPPSKTRYRPPKGMTLSSPSPRVLDPPMEQEKELTPGSGRRNSNSSHDLLAGMPGTNALKSGSGKKNGHVLGSAMEAGLNDAIGDALGDMGLPVMQPSNTKPPHVETTENNVNINGSVQPLPVKQQNKMQNSPMNMKMMPQQAQMVVGGGGGNRNVMPTQTQTHQLYANTVQQEALVADVTKSRQMMASLSENNLRDLNQRLKEVNMQTAAQKMALERVMEQLQQDIAERDRLLAQIEQEKAAYKHHYTQTEQCTLQAQQIRTDIKQARKTLENGQGPALEQRLKCMEAVSRVATLTEELRRLRGESVASEKEKQSAIADVSKAEEVSTVLAEENSLIDRELDLLSEQIQNLEAEKLEHMKVIMEGKNDAAAARDRLVKLTAENEQSRSNLEVKYTELNQMRLKYRTALRATGGAAMMNLSASSSSSTTNPRPQVSRTFSELSFGDFDLKQSNSKENKNQSMTSSSSPVDPADSRVGKSAGLEAADFETFGEDENATLKTSGKGSSGGTVMEGKEEKSGGSGGGFETFDDGGFEDFESSTNRESNAVALPPRPTRQRDVQSQSHRRQPSMGMDSGFEEFADGPGFEAAPGGIGFDETSSQSQFDEFPSSPTRVSESTTRSTTENESQNVWGDFDETDHNPGGTADIDANEASAWGDASGGTGDGGFDDWDDKPQGDGSAWTDFG